MIKPRTWIDGPARAARQWLAQRDVAAHGLQVRELVPDDLPRVQARLPASGPGPGPEDLERQRRQELGIAVAWVGRKAVGVGFIEWRGPRAAELHDRWPGVPEIFRLQVQPAYRSLRVGARLIGFIEQWARQTGKSRIGLGVHCSNTRALALYRRLGYGPEATPFSDGYVMHTPDGTPQAVQEPALFLTRELIPDSSSGQLSAQSRDRPPTSAAAPLRPG